MIVIAALEPPTVIAGLDDVAVMGQAVEECRGHLGVAEDTGPFTESKIGRDDDRGTLVEPADEVEQELPAGLGEGQVAELIKDDEVHARQMISKATLANVAGLGLEPVDEIDYVVETAAGAGPDAASGNGDGEMRFAGAGSANQHGITLLCEEGRVGCQAAS